MLPGRRGSLGRAEKLPTKRFAPKALILAKPDSVVVSHLAVSLNSVVQLPALETTPIVKWVGGKRQLQDQILKVIGPVFRRDEATYFEPFLGGGAIFFALKPPRSRISDVNEGLVNVYRTVRDSLPMFLDQMKSLELEYNGLDEGAQKLRYLEIRNDFNASPRLGVDQAVNFMFLNKAGFNGLYRENSKGHFNVPFGQRKKIVLANRENLVAVSELLSRTEIELHGYSEALSSARPGDLVYLDPPYVPLSATSAFTSYTADGFNYEDQINLADAFRDLANRGVHVALSNSSALAVKELYEGFRQTPMMASRAISASAQGRAKVSELLVTNF
jgi:DNA adenine methylase